MLKVADSLITTYHLWGLYSSHRPLLVTSSLKSRAFSSLKRLCPSSASVVGYIHCNPQKQGNLKSFDSLHVSNPTSATGLWSDQHGPRPNARDLDAAWRGVAAALSNRASTSNLPLATWQSQGAEISATIEAPTPSCIRTPEVKRNRIDQ